MTRKRSLAALVAAATLFSSSVAIASPSFQTRLSIGYSTTSGGQFAGHLRSHAGCVAGREVSLYRQTPGADARVGSNTVGATGRWKVGVARPPAGDYYAKVPRLRTGAGVCAAAKSATTHVS